MKFEKFWRINTLENLVKADESIPHEYDSYLVKRVRELRRIPLHQFTIEDLRMMIGQDIGLTYLLPLALESLEKDLFAEGDYYPGDLLNMVLKIKPGFWKDHPEYWRRLHKLIKYRLEELKAYWPKLSLGTFYSDFY